MAEPSFVAEMLNTGLRGRGCSHFHEFIGWSFTYTVDGNEHVLVTQLTPIGRGSTLEDWRNLGAVAAALGAPFESMPESIRSAPNAPHRVVWTVP